MRTVILTIGTRGDVQPYIALGRGLQAAGHDVTIATLGEFEALVTEYGLKHATLRGDFLKAARPGEEKTLNWRTFPSYIKEWIAMAHETLEDSWTSAKDAELLILNPAALGGYDIAEKLGVPTFAAFPTPLYSPTREFPSPFFPVNTLGPFNKLSHQLLAKLGPMLYGRPIGKWRRETLQLPSKKSLPQIPMLYAYSEAVVPRPADWDASVVVTGYWFLDAPSDWQPDPALVKFLQAGPPPVYVGFGSMFMEGGAERAEIVLKALKRAGQRAVLALGWGGLTPEKTPEGVFVLDAVPHDWLFPQVSVVVHHGGAGTTGAALRAGRPTLICPFVGDQPFWGRRVAALGAGPSPLPQSKLTAERLGEAIRLAATDGGMRERAEALGERIRNEDGVKTAVDYINRHL